MTGLLEQQLGTVTVDVFIPVIYAVTFLQNLTIF